MLQMPKGIRNAQINMDTMLIVCEDQKQRSEGADGQHPGRHSEGGGKMGAIPEKWM